MLSLRNFTVARGGIAVLEGVSLTLGAGEALVLRGPNGLGKTTLLRTIAGLQPAMAGEIDADPETLAYASHADGVKPTLSVLENLRFWASVFGQGEEAIAAALSAMDLEKLTDRPAQNLSAGQKRRLGLARLAVTGRAVWLLDEPTVSLDAASVGLFAAMVKRHLASGGAAVLATHIDLGLETATVLDLSPFRARPPSEGGMGGAFDEAFL
ncbi:heme ABC exporter ATP-binding protein CcmA [Falsigemmobacter intermedius]|uniref:Heme ABC exporter ATP-binding protein CcmA n=1 Tax=Falsigemmobacter intermedius TaxID=1553448 RepID=A0A444MDY2_9RHOB|nr:heme ABC exporter ATP-binding protein CcmA [Falsigemmobacter intermedius]RWY43031.1 heme ABC exporter ATP-binding protein CcmA [Falsigemmobacter intermedius]